MEMTVFFAMVYILMVNANMFADPFGDGSNPLGVSYGAIYIATAISAVIGTILAGVISNLPLAQASGMGLNAFFLYCLHRLRSFLCKRSGINTCRGYSFYSSDSYGTQKEDI